MDGLIIEIAKNTASWLGQDGIFIAFISLISLAFILNLILSCCISEYVMKKRLWQPLFSAFLVFVCAGLSDLAGYAKAICYFLAGFSILTFIPMLLIRVKTYKITEKQRDLVKFIDSNISNAQSIEPEFERHNFSCENFTSTEPKQAKVSDFEVDFQHVKSVIARLDYFGLKESDKKQVKELENALIVAEKGEFNQQIKSKINDGLGALLKIMSKYGV